MTPTPGGMPKPQSSQQPGNEPGGANGMYGRFGQTPGQQPSQGFRQKVDGVRRGFGGQRQQRGGMRQASGMGQMQNNSQQDPVGYDGRPVQRQSQPQSNEQTAYRRNPMQPDEGGATGFNPQPGMSLSQAQNAARSLMSKNPGVAPQGDSLGINGQPVDRSQGQPTSSRDYGRYGGGMGPATANARQADKSQGQSSYRSSGQYDRDRAGGMQDGAVAGRETEFNSDPRHAQAAAMGQRRLAEQSMQQPMQQADYGRFAPGPAAGAMGSRASANPFGGDDDIAFDAGATGSMVVSGGQYDRDQQPMNDAASTDPTIVANREAKRRAQGAPVGAVQNTQYMGSDQPMPTATTTQAQPSVAPVQNTQNMGGQQSPPVATKTKAQPAPSGFATPFGMMRFGAPEQLKADDMQPRDTFQTGQSSLRQPMSSLEGQSRRRRERFGYGA
jgi:hypothetical protein